MFSRSLCWAIQQPLIFLWSTNPVFQQPLIILRCTSPVIHLSLKSRWSSKQGDPITHYTVRNRTKYRCLFHLLVQFRTELSQLLEQFQTDHRYYSSNSWYDLVPILAGTDLYAKFSNNCWWHDVVPVNRDWVYAICFICWYDFVLIMAGIIYSHGSTGWYDFVPIITGVFYLLVRFRASHRWIWSAGPWLLCFSRSICFGQSINFCDPITRWSSSHFRFAVH